MSPLAACCGSGVVHLPFEFPLRHGGALRAGQLAFACAGLQDAPAVLVLGGISSGRHVCAHDGDARAGWWEGFAGAGAPLDAERLRLLGIDWLGGNGASSGPRTDPGREFPVISTSDQADAIAHLLDELGIEKLHALAGASFGAMVGLCFAARHPSRIRHLVAISGAGRSHPLATAWRALQRRIVALGRAAGDEAQGLALARALAMTTYRSAEEFAQRFAAEPLAAERYVLARGAAWAREFAPGALASLTLALDLHGVDVAPIRCPVTLVGIRQDRLVPIEQLRDLRARLGARAVLHELDSIYGHDAFLKERDALAPILRAAVEVTR